MRKKLLLGLAIALFLVIPVCQALDDILLDIEPVDNRVLSGDWAIFDVSITNRGRFDDTFILTVKEEGVEWSVLTESAYDYTTGIFIKSGSQETTRILLKDKGLVPNPTKPYSVQLDVKSLNNNYRASALMYVYLLSEKPFVYGSDINVTYNIPRYIDPRNIYSFKVALFNNNQKDIKNLKIAFDSMLVKREAFVELEPLNRKVIEFTVPFDEEIKPTIDTLTITVTEDNRTLYRSTSPIEIVGYRMGFKQTNKTESFFLKETTAITLTNNDNIEQQQKFMLRKRLLDRIFTSIDPKADTLEKNGKKYYSWDVKLAPDESATISITTNYRMLFYVLVIVVIVFVIYFYIRNPVSILKNCDIMKTSDGGINEIKVVLVVRNRTQEKIKNLRLVDMIPKIAHVEKRKEVGTLHPSRMVNTSKGVAVEWNFDMDPKEERLVSYYIKSKLSILGGLRLPKAQAQLNVKGKKKKVRSNDIHLAGK